MEMQLTNRSQFTLRVAAAITGDNPWKMGYSVYRGTFHSLKRRLPQIEREHGGNTVQRWYYHGFLINYNTLDAHLGWTD